MRVKFTPFLSLIATPVRGMIQSFHYEGEAASVFQLETFGFRPGGQMELSFDHFELAGSDRSEQVRAGFLMHLTESETAARQDIEEALARLEVSREDCWLDRPGDKDEIVDMNGSEAGKELRHHIGEGEEGLYSLIFVRCKPSEASVSFKMHAKFYNVNKNSNTPNYLSAGENALPALYFLFFFSYALAMATWVWFCRLKKDNVQAIHHLMTVLLFFKTLSLLFEAVRYRHYQVNGYVDGWTIVFFVFNFIKGVMRFLVILLVGTGWSLLKPYLSDREKKIVLFVLVLQVVDNICLVAFDEISQTSPGSARWLTTRDVFHLIDLVCCCSVLFPIVWSIRHLRQATVADGKLQNTLTKLTLFRQYYLLVVSYIYFSRIVVFLVKATLPYDLLYIQQLLDEIATLAFYGVTGYRFRPKVDNPYLQLRSDEEAVDLEEFGLEDSIDHSGLEMQGRADGTSTVSV